jgi:pyrroline-5-carboxylate reductase
MLEGKKICFIGAGSMAQAMIWGLLSSNLIKPESIYVTNKSDRAKLNKLGEKWGVNITYDKALMLQMADIIILAVKPKDVREVLKTIKAHVTRSHLILSVVAGIGTDLIQTLVGKEVPIIRAMPNTSCLVKESATALALGKYADKEDEAIGREIFSSIGKVIVVEETALDAVTGLSGSGPAYVYLMIEAMVDAGIKAGLSSEVSKELAVQTVLGAARMLIETGEEPTALRQKVTSPGGTTFAGLTVLEKAGFRNSLIKAINRAAQRSKELGMEM